MSRTAEYRAWRGMMNRTDPYTKDAKWRAAYADRGIVVCPEWRDSFERFYADMGPRPTHGHSVDRIDNDGPYSPENCRWATFEQQVANTQKCIAVTVAGVTYPTETAAAAAYGIPKHRFWQRLQMGWPVEQALTTPYRAASRRYKPVMAFGEVFPTVTAAAEAYGLAPITLRLRLRRGWPVEKALLTRPERTGTI